MINLLPLARVTAATRLSRASFYSRIQAGLMPRPVKVGPKLSAWPDHEIEADIIRRALNSASGSKFHALHTGRWREYYQSQSEADFAYIDMIAFWSRNREQIARVFHASPLGARAKANRADYLNPMIGRSFDRLPPPIDIEAVQAMLAEAIAAKLLEGPQ